MLFASKCQRAAWELATRLGVAVVAPFRARSVRLASKDDIDGNGGDTAAVFIVDGAAGGAVAPLRCKSLVLAPGAWLSSLVSDLFGIEIPTRVSAETVSYYAPRAECPAEVDHSFRAMPVFVAEVDMEATDGNHGFYGLPMIDVPGIKASQLYAGPAVRPDARPLAAGGTEAQGGEAEAEAEARVRAAVAATDEFVAATFPHVEHTPMHTVSCLYTTTADHDYIISQLPGHPRVVLAGGGSGHAFKTAPAIGQMAAALALGEAPPLPTARFDVARLLG